MWHNAFATALVILAITNGLLVKSGLAQQDIRQLDKALKRFQVIHLSKVSEIHGGKSEPSFKLRLNVFDKDYELLMENGPSVFSADAQLQLRGNEGDGRRLHIARLKLPTPVKGRLAGVENSDVLGLLSRGIFSGYFDNGETRLYVEPAGNFIEGAAKSDALVYDQRDIIATKIPCGVDGINFSSHAHDSKSAAEAVRMYRRGESTVRGDRAAATGVCRLKVFSDYDHYNDLHGGDYSRTIKDMMHIVQQTDSIFSGTDFDDDGRPDNIRIKVGAYEVFRSRSQYRFSSTNLNLDDYLDLLSELDHSRYCAAVAFSGRKFESVNNAFGLAHRGRICDARRRTKNGKAVSYNCAVISQTRIIGGRLLMAECVVAFAHELAHVFGAPHDNMEFGCHSTDPNTQYIMNDHLNPARYSNNMKFSSCSKKFITNNLRARTLCLACRGTDCVIQGSKGQPLNTVSPYLLLILPLCSRVTFRIVR